MRISGNQSIDMNQVKTSTVVNSNIDSDVQKQGSEFTSQEKHTKHIEPSPLRDNSEDTKQKIQEAVGKMNEMLEVNNSTSKFIYHDGLDRYYVSVVDRETEEVVKEIPPKKLLDAFYEMQKMLGMIVDEKI